MAILKLCLRWDGVVFFTLWNCFCATLLCNIVIANKRSSGVHREKSPPSIAPFHSSLTRSNTTQNNLYVKGAWKNSFKVTPPGYWIDSIYKLWPRICFWNKRRMHYIKIKPPRAFIPWTPSFVVAYILLSFSWQISDSLWLILRAGARFSKLLVITGPVKLFCFPF